MRWIVVHAVPKPRARAANMKLHIAGNTFPIMEAAIMAGACSMREPTVHAITSAGESPMWSARKSADAAERAC